MAAESEEFLSEVVKAWFKQPSILIQVVYRLRNLPELCHLP